MGGGANSVAQRDQLVVLVSDGVRTLVTADREPHIWENRVTRYAIAGRGLLDHNEVTIVQQRDEADSDGILLGLSSAPMSMTSPNGGTATIPANEVWAAPTTKEWRCTIESATDLRLVVLHEAVVRTGKQVGACLLFGATEGQVMLRLFLRQVTPAWIDRQARKVGDLARVDLDTLIPIQPTEDARSRETAAAFAMVVDWSLSRARDLHDGDHRLDAALDFIDDNLFDHGLTTERLTRAMYVSRRALQQMFKPYGGVANYIRERRVEAATQMLTTTGEAPDLDLIAKLTGLGSRRTLERAIRQEHGLTPLNLYAQHSHPSPPQQPRDR